MSTGGQLEAVPEAGELSPGTGLNAPVAVEAGAEAAIPKSETRTPQEICASYGSDFLPPGPLDKVAVALTTLYQHPLNARRITPERGHCGWYIWGGGGRSSQPGFFQSLPVAHLLERCPQIMPFLGLAPGWRVRLLEDEVEIMPPHQVAPPANVLNAFGTASRAPSVKQWVWLSILLHLLAIVLFGDTTGAGAQRGERLGGPLNVTLQAPAKVEPESRLLLRADKRLRSLDQRVSPSTMPAPPPAESRADPPEVAPTSPAVARKSQETPVAPVMPRVIATDVEKPQTTFVVPAQIPELISPPEPPVAAQPEPLPRMDSFTPPKLAPAPKLEPSIVIPSQSLPALTAPSPASIEREPAVSIEPAPRLRTFTPSPIAPPKIDSESVAPPVELPRMAPLAPPQPEREFMRPAELLPRLAPVAPASPIDVPAPATVAPRLVAPTIPFAPPATGLTPTIPSTLPPALPSASVLPASLRSSAGIPSGTERGSEKDGSGLAAPALGPAGSGSAPRIDLNAVRQRAREIDREGQVIGARTLLPFNVKPKEDTRTKEQKAFDKALKRPDCREAYAGMGLAAVVPLLWDAVSEKGCKW